VDTRDTLTIKTEKNIYKGSYNLDRKHPHCWASHSTGIRGRGRTRALLIVFFSVVHVVYTGHDLVLTTYNWLALFPRDRKRVRHHPPIPIQQQARTHVAIRRRGMQDGWVGQQELQGHLRDAEAFAFQGTHHQRPHTIDNCHASHCFCYTHPQTGAANEWW